MRCKRTIVSTDCIMYFAYAVQWSGYVQQWVFRMPSWQLLTYIRGKSRPRLQYVLYSSQFSTVGWGGVYENTYVQYVTKHKKQDRYRIEAGKAVALYRACMARMPGATFGFMVAAPLALLASYATFYVPVRHRK